MTEQEVSEVARDLLLETYGDGPQIFEPTDVDGDRPDLIVVVEYHLEGIQVRRFRLNSWTDS